VMIDILTRAVRMYLTGRNSRYAFRTQRNPSPRNVSRINLYVHVPFCRNMCPYCPYYKVKYDSSLVEPYVNAILNEIDMYYALYGRMEISSIYIGGGTPTLLTDELGIVLDRLRKHFHVAGDICIETSPNDLDKVKIGKLHQHSIGLISTGIQSFQDRWLRLIGRKYDSTGLDRILGILTKSGFKSVNVDLMFALPGQTVSDVRFDLQKAIDCGVNQVTVYPLFTFPYSTVGRYMHLKQVKMPKLKIRRRMYMFIHRFLSAKDFKRVSVWGFKKGSVPRYSSVTRDNYIGLGPGAGSHMVDGYYLNTFSLDEYIHRCRNREFPVALFMPFSKTMQHFFWLYWRLYDTYVPCRGLENISPKIKRKTYLLLAVFRLLGFLIKKDNRFELTREGSFWVHLLQNYFSLRYINKIWTGAMKEPYPEIIAF
jgi:oxygen-independent coproporphyrinogen-3 oxidase